MSTTSRRSYLLLTSVLLLTGCSTTSRLAGPTSTFATDVAQVQTGSQSAMTSMMSQDLAHQAFVMVKNATLAEEDFQPFIRPVDLQYRMLVLQGLLDYANALKTLAGTDSSADAAKAGATLKSDMDSTIKDIRSLPGLSNAKDVSGVCDAFVQLGILVENAVLAHERDEALKDSLEKAQPQINTICDIFAGEMESHSDPITKQAGHAVFYDQLSDTFNESIEDLEKQYQTAHQGDQQKYNDAVKQAQKAGATYDPATSTAFKNSLGVATSFSTLEQKKQFTLALSRAIGISFEKLKAAHAALLEEAQTKKPSQAAFNALHLQLETVSIYLNLAKGSDQSKSSNDTKTSDQKTGEENANNN